MAISRNNDTIILDGICAVEDAEVLMQELQAGATSIDWSGCTHLHAACFQMILAAQVPVFGTPANPELVRWVKPILHRIEMPFAHVIETEPAFELET